MKKIKKKYLPVAEPNSHNFFVKIKCITDFSDFLWGRFRILDKCFFQRISDVVFNWSSLFALLAKEIVTIEIGNLDGRAPVSISEPFLEQRLQFTHIIKAKIQRLKSGNRRLREIIAVHSSHGKTNITLSVTQLYPLLLELSGKIFKLLKGYIFISCYFSTWQGCGIW